MEAYVKECQVRFFSFGLKGLTEVFSDDDCMGDKWHLLSRTQQEVAQKSLSVLMTYLLAPYKRGLENNSEGRFIKRQLSLNGIHGNKRAGALSIAVSAPHKSKWNVRPWQRRGLSALKETRISLQVGVVSYRNSWAVSYTHQRPPESFAHISKSFSTYVRL